MKRLSLHEEIRKKNQRDAIINICIKHFQPYDIFQDTFTRKREFAQRRQLTMYVLRKFTKLSLSDIGKVFNKDHATALHAIKNMEIYIEDEKAYVEEIRHLFLDIRNDIIDILGTIDSDSETPEERLVKVRKRNQKLVHREIYRKEQLAYFRKQLNYIPQRYSEKMIKIVEECMAPLSH